MSSWRAGVPSAPCTGCPSRTRTSWTRRGFARAAPRPLTPDPGTRTAPPSWRPLPIPDHAARFRAPLGRDFKGARVGWWRGLGGIPFEPEIRRLVDANRSVFEDLGCIVEDEEPDFTGVDEAFPTLRYASNHPAYSALVRQRPEWVKDTIKFEIAEAERRTGADIGRALERQG